MGSIGIPSVMTMRADLIFIRSQLQSSKVSAADTK